jgi:hypothetical protein
MKKKEGHVSVCRFPHIYKQEQGRALERNIQSCGMQVIRRRNPPLKLLGVEESAESVYVNFHLWPQVTDHCKYIEWSIWTPKRVMKLK